MRTLAFGALQVGAATVGWLLLSCLCHAAAAATPVQGIPFRRSLKLGGLLSLTLGGAMLLAYFIARYTAAEGWVFATAAPAFILADWLIIRRVYRTTSARAAVTLVTAALYAFVVTVTLYRLAGYVARP